MNRKILQDIINDAVELGLPELHVKESREFLEYNEYGLSLDTIITPLYELQIKINKEFYEKVQKAANEMKVPVDDFKYLQELIT